MSIPKPSISITAVSSSLLPEWHHDNHLETKDSQSSISSSSHSSEIYNFRSSFLLDIPTWMFRNHLKLKYPKQNSSSSHTSHPPVSQKSSTINHLIDQVSNPGTIRQQRVVKSMVFREVRQFGGLNNSTHWHVTMSVIKFSEPQLPYLYNGENSTKSKELKSE